MEQQAKAIMKMPNKKEREEIEALEALLQQERRETKAKEEKNKLTVERIRLQIKELQVIFIF